MESDNIEYMEIDDTDSVSGQPARQVPPQTPMESGMELLNNIINKDTIPKESLKRALEIKKSERKKLREHQYESPIRTGSGNGCMALDQWHRKKRLTGARGVEKVGKQTRSDPMETALPGKSQSDSRKSVRA